MKYEPLYTFSLFILKAWAGIGSDISYYLNSHHIDLHVWAMQGKARCVSVRAIATTGVVAEKLLGRPCEDTITVTAEWENFNNNSGHQKSKGICLVKICCRTISTYIVWA